ncbi:hypothetical protein L211DRAFT_854143 [Terfezia boudieri ATCC MYA-4762]|uniref:Uncharacterized protein n=1 Tax=Terfezia boudieri ATCC MYA-4762 TaxID=1051890 RepID=A0A3N4LAC9_9PEZI|nr:hypothetical protein L211DRAFT_854143 [Terfezia boudieri ATCC MYA-4762]
MPPKRKQLDANEDSEDDNHVTAPDNAATVAIPTLCRAPTNRTEDAAGGLPTTRVGTAGPTALSIATKPPPYTTPATRASPNHPERSELWIGDLEPIIATPSTTSMANQSHLDCITLLRAPDSPVPHARPIFRPRFRPRSRPVSVPLSAALSPASASVSASASAPASTSAPAPGSVPFRLRLSFRSRSRFRSVPLHVLLPHGRTSLFVPGHNICSATYP